jgi:hypothetical protein
MTSSAQLEREAEDTRTQLARTLDELRERITPGQLVDQAVDYAKDSGGGMFVRNLGRQTVANPIPVALIGAGIGWLMLANGRQSAAAASINRAAETAIDQARHSMSEAGDRIKEFGQTASAQTGEKAGQARDWMDDWSSSAGDDTRASGAGLAETAEPARRSAQATARDAGARAGAAAGSIRDAAASAYETATSGAAAAYGRAAGQAQQATADVMNTASNFGQRAAGASRDLLQFCKSQPLLLAGLGMALGAIVGALIPPTETEDALIGESSDQIKDQARGFAKEQVDNAASTVESAAEAGLDQAETEFNFEQAGSQAGPPAEASLVPEAEQSAEPSDEQPAEQER